MAKRVTKSPDLKSPVAIGRRLRLTRTALGLTQRELCRRARLKESAYSYMENGRSRPSIDAAIAIAETFGVTLDWIFLGDSANIPHRLVVTIEGLQSVRDDGST